ncbi:hypothetical protein ACP4OV_031446 [Aristida adscensionis]
MGNSKRVDVRRKKEENKASRIHNSRSPNTDRAVFGWNGKRVWPPAQRNRRGREAAKQAPQVSHHPRFPLYPSHQQQCPIAVRLAGRRSDHQPQTTPQRRRFRQIHPSRSAAMDGSNVYALRDDSSALFRDVDELLPGQYEVCLLHSEDKVWTAMDVSVPPQLVKQHSDFEEGFRHVTAKVIAIGGEHGTMAFADLWRGILLYDVHRGNDDDSLLRYVTTPHQLIHGGKR